VGAVVEDKIVDGRVARGERSRRALAEALISLLEEGDVRPTARRIAQRAGVSLRLVFHHFDDLESILREAVAIQEHRHWRHVRPVSPTLPVADRVARIVGQRATLYQAVAPVRRSAELVADGSVTVAAELRRGRESLRGQLGATFAPEIEGRRPADARVLLDELDVATSWETWEQLERLGRPTSVRRRTMQSLTLAVLSLPPTGGTP
jgi:TetR/AcrR family transcriptional regulator, regulator of autoinduction and epiphytic fitness